MTEDCVQRIIKVGKKILPSVLTRGIEIDVNYTIMWNEELVGKSKDELLLRCLGKEEHMKVIGEVHDEKNVLVDQKAWSLSPHEPVEAQKIHGPIQHGPIQQAPSIPMNPVIKPWPFRGWAMDLIGKIYPASRKHHCFIIVATDYFTKWVETKPVKSTTSQEIITFIEEQILQRFGIPESITTDRGSSSISRETLDMAEAFKFKLLQSTPYYAQANGQAESSNKVAGYGKWSPTWERPFIVKQVLGLGAYRLQDQDRDIYAVPTNGKWLKKFYPTMWDS
ncbi:unnamed protein product [Prunus armeniaca]